MCSDGPQIRDVSPCLVHRSSVPWKGDALDPVIAKVTRGQPYRHVMGFEAGERRRAEKDAGYNTDLRTGEYPLITWGWFRDDYSRIITTVFPHARTPLAGSRGIGEQQQRLASPPSAWPHSMRPSLTRSRRDRSMWVARDRSRSGQVVRCSTTHADI